MGSKLAAKGGVKPKREVETQRVKQQKKKTEKIEKKEEEEQKEEEPVKQSEEEELQELDGFSSTDDSDFDDAQEEEGSDSDSDSDEEVEDQDEEESNQIVKTQESHEVKKLPKSNEKASKKSSKISKGVIYIGRLPEGFEENELKKYFNQFGDITNINLPRNHKTGRSRHYAFLEFSNVEDAKVAQDTMNNYLLLNHQLKVELVDEEFKSNSKKFKKSFFKASKVTKDVKTLNKNVQDKRSKREAALKAAGISL